MRWRTRGHEAARVSPRGALRQLAGTGLSEKERRDADPEAVAHLLERIKEWQQSLVFHAST